MGKMKSPLVAFVGLAVLSLLTGCVEKFGGGPNALSRDGDELLVAVCVGIDARELYGSVQGDDGERPFLDLEGAAWIETGSILRPGVLDGFEGYFNSVNAQSIHALPVGLGLKRSLIQCHNRANATLTAAAQTPSRSCGQIQLLADIGSIREVKGVEDHNDSINMYCTVYLGIDALPIGMCSLRRRGGTVHWPAIRGWCA